MLDEMKTALRLASTIHHAYGIVGDTDTVVFELKEIFTKNLGVAAVGNPDFFHEKFETLTIEDARRIQDIHASKAFSSDTPRIFLIELYGATREAQNALLKILEEPRPGNHFFLVMPSFDILLPTLRSRLNLVRPQLPAQGVQKTDSNDFIKKSLKEKIAFVDALSAGISDGTTMKHEAIDFLNQLESSMYEKYSRSKIAQDLAVNASAFETIARARDYMNDRAPSVKMLLEYVALSV
jgi:DNA polymerase III delta prime subunit